MIPEGNATSVPEHQDCSHATAGCSPAAQEAGDAGLPAKMLEVQGLLPHSNRCMRGRHRPVPSHRPVAKHFNTTPTRILDNHRTISLQHARSEDGLGKSAAHLRPVTIALQPFRTPYCPVLWRQRSCRKQTWPGVSVGGSELLLVRIPAEENQCAVASRCCRGTRWLAARVFQSICNKRKANAPID